MSGKPLQLFSTTKDRYIINRTIKCNLRGILTPIQKEAKTDEIGVRRTLFHTPSVYFWTTADRIDDYVIPLGNRYPASTRRQRLSACPFLSLFFLGAAGATTDTISAYRAPPPTRTRQKMRSIHHNSSVCVWFRMCTLCVWDCMIRMCVYI